MFATVQPTTIWGAILIASGLVHLIFRRYYARRAAVMQRAHRDAAPRATRRLHWVGSESTNLTLATFAAAASVTIGGILLVVGIA